MRAALWSALYFLPESSLSDSGRPYELKEIYKAPTAEAALQTLVTFDSAYGDRYPMVVKKWRSLWENVIPFFGSPEPIRKVIYTTNAVESLNSQLKKMTRKRSALPTNDSVRKVLYIALLRALRMWNRPLKDWAAALNFFSIVFEERVPIYSWGATYTVVFSLPRTGA